MSNAAGHREPVFRVIRCNRWLAEILSIVVQHLISHLNSMVKASFTSVEKIKHGFEYIPNMCQLNRFREFV